MTEDKKDFRSPLKKAKGWGASKHAVSHWWLQRLTAVALAILMPLFVISLLASMLSPDVGIVTTWFASPINALGTIVMLIALFWHAKLGFQVVVEDYVKCTCSKFGLLIVNNFIAIAFAALGILAVIRMHLIDVTSFPT